MNNKKILLLGSLSAFALALTPTQYWGSSQNSGALAKSMTIVLIVLVFLMFDLFGQYLRDLAGYPAPVEEEVLEGELLPPEPLVQEPALPSVEIVIPENKEPHSHEIKTIEHKNRQKLLASV